MSHLYIHVPFCKRRCSYCDFSIAVRKQVPAKRFVDMVMSEMRLRRDGEGVPREGIETVYLGGGTPSLLPPEHLGDLLQRLGEELGFGVSVPELTVEANPDDVTLETAERWRAAGVNRVSLGAQSLNQGVLEWMHRPHAAEDSVRAMRALRSAGMPSVSVDVIFALPQTLLADPVSDLERLLVEEPHHVSAYGLTVEPRTPLARWLNRGSVDEAPDAAYADEFCGVHDLLTRHGYEHYEVSNYAKPGKRSLHNQAYWSGASYEGLGPSAHRFDGVVRRWNLREWAAYAKAMDDGRDPTEGEERLSEAQIRLERTYLGLRTADGVEMGSDDRPMNAAWQAAVNNAWITMSGTRARATVEGWLRLDALVTSLTTSGEGG